MICCQTARLTWWTRYEKKSVTDHAETDRDTQEFVMESMKDKSVDSSEPVTLINVMKREDKAEIHFEEKPHNEQKEHADKDLVVVVTYYADTHL